jgi:hypothetical protein
LSGGIFAGKSLSSRMKSKNLVSLSVALVFLVLSVTGLLIYFAQGSHAVEHIHAWFGILFVGAAVFHIVNNWSSLKGYTKDRRTGGIRREFVLPLLVALVFTVGIAIDLPVFGKLANAGKTLVWGNKPRGGPMAQTAVDSVARVVETAYANACSAGDTAALSTVFSKNATVWTGSGEVRASDALPKGKVVNSVQRAMAMDDNVIVVHGTSTRAVPAETVVFTHVLKRQENAWQIVAAQLASPSAKLLETTAAK